MNDERRAPGAAKVKIYEMAEAARHWEIALAGSGLARLYCEVFRDAKDEPQSTCRLHFDGDVRPDLMREVIEAVTAEVLSFLPHGVCIVYRGHVVSSFDYGRAQG